jgi:hypothetical protein
MYCEQERRIRARQALRSPWCVAAATALASIIDCPECGLVSASAVPFADAKDSLK